MLLSWLMVLCLLSEFIPPPYLLLVCNPAIVCEAANSNQRLSCSLSLKCNRAMATRATIVLNLWQKRICTFLFGILEKNSISKERRKEKSQCFWPGFYEFLFSVPIIKDSRASLRLSMFYEALVRRHVPAIGPAQSMRSFRILAERFPSPVSTGWPLYEAFGRN
jgi:hypothetical protein